MVRRGELGTAMLTLPLNIWDGPWHKPLSTQMGPHTCMTNSKRDAARAGSLIRLDEQITLMPSAHPDAP